MEATDLNYSCCNPTSNHHD